MKRPTVIAAALAGLLLAAAPLMYRLARPPQTSSAAAPPHYFVPAATADQDWLRCDFTNTLGPGTMSSLWEEALQPCNLGTGWTYPSPGGVVAMARHPHFAMVLPTDDWTHLLLTVKAFPGPERPEPQTMTVRVNGQEIGTLEVPQSWTTLQLPVPPGALRVGENLISSTFGYRVSPAEGGRKRDSRLFAVHLRQAHVVRSADGPLAEGRIKRIIEAPRPADGARAARFEPDRGRFAVSRSGTLVLPLQLPADAGDLRVELQRVKSPVGLADVSLRLRSLSSDAAIGPISPTVDGRTARGTARLDADLRELAGDSCLLMVDVGPAAAAAGIRVSAPQVTSTPRSEAGAAAAPGDESPAHPRPDIVMITLDAARADRFSCYGHDRPTTPNIDRLATESLIYRNVFALAPYTLCSVPTMVTGLSFLDHQVTNHGHRLTGEATTLAESLRGAGYRTACFSASPNNSRTIGTDQGYDQFVETWKVVPRSESSDPFLLSRLAVEWIAAYDEDAPLHLQLHYVPPHAPYTPQPQFDRFTDPSYDGPCDGGHGTIGALDSGALAPRPEDVDHMLALYDGNLLEGDAAVGLVLEALRRRPRWRDTVVLVTSDHGEAFLEHGRIGHNSTVFDEMLHVPFVLRLPETLRAGDFDREQLGTLEDIVPTLLATAGIEPDPVVTGRNLLRSDREAHADRGRVVISRTTGDEPLYGLRTLQWKLMLAGSGQGALFHLVEDPGERRDLSLRARLFFSGLGALLTERLDRPPRFEALPELEELPEDDVEMLKALGYLE